MTSYAFDVHFPADQTITPPPPPSPPTTTSLVAHQQVTNKRSNHRINKQLIAICSRAGSTTCGVNVNKSTKSTVNYTFSHKQQHSLNQSPKPITEL